MATSHEIVRKSFIFCLICMVCPSFGYMSAGLKDHYLSDALLQEIIDRMGKDLVDTEYDADTMNDMPAQLALMTRASKDMENERMDYDAIMEGNPSPSLRDTEFLQHSTLWGNQYVSGGAGEGPHRLKPQVKTDASLPAYCNPPNPCPVGYTEEQGCTLDFENTAGYSREYQSSQKCMCDSEHMFNCPGQDNDDNTQMETDLESFLSRQFHTQEHKNLVAKKFHVKKSGNPFLQGEKLPIAAKKGINVNF